MNKGNSDIVLVALVVGAFLLLTQREAPTPLDDPDTVPPAAETRQQLRPLRSLAAQYPEPAKELATLYRAATRIAERPEISSYQKFINAIVEAENIKVGLSDNLKMPGWGNARAEFIDSQMGTDSIALTDVSRQTLVATLQSIVWALENPE